MPSVAVVCYYYMPCKNLRLMLTALNFSLSDIASFTGQTDITMVTDQEEDLCVLWTKGLAIFC